MYICVCNAITDSDIKQCIDAGIDSVPLIKRELEFCSSCGRCSNFIRELVNNRQIPPQSLTSPEQSYARR